MFERLRESAWATASALGAVFVAAVLFELVFADVPDLNALVVLAALEAAVLLVAGHANSGGAWPHPRR